MKTKFWIRIRMKFFSQDFVVFAKRWDTSSYTHNVIGKPQEFLIQIVRRFPNTLINSNKIQANVLQRSSIFKYLHYRSNRSLPNDGPQGNLNWPFSKYVVFRINKVKQKVEILKYATHTWTSSSVAPMSAARSEMLKLSGYLHDLKASSKVSDFSLSASNFFRISIAYCICYKANNHRFKFESLTLEIFKFL